MKKIDKDELERGTGTDDNPALVAVDGKVYDVTSSKMWKKGVHVKTHKAGQELSQAIEAAPHGREVFEAFEPIGELEETEETEEAGPPKPPAVIERILDEHPHPISVHFPIALSIVGALSMFLFLVLRKESFELFTLYCITLAALAAPVSIATGLLSWYYNYNAVWTHIYRVKTTLSVFLVVFQLTALGVRVFAFDGPDLGAPLYWLYVGLALAMAPTVMGLGYFGGKITFPS
jgi:predicted heme/steroid binding protein/uncharacterized membrane protein